MLAQSSTPEKQAGGIAEGKRVSLPPTQEAVWDCIISGDMPALKSFLVDHAAKVVGLVRVF